MSFVIDPSCTGVAGIVRDNQKRLAKLEEIVFHNEHIDLPDVNIPDVIDNEVIHVPQKKEDDAFLDVLLQKLTSIRDESSMLHLELESISQMDNLIESESDDNVSICTENTEHLQEFIDANHDIKITPSCQNCKSCMRLKSKEIKKNKKAKEKERRAYLRQLKINERDVLMIEQNELQHKLNEFRNQINRISDISQKQKNELTERSLELNSSVVKIKTKL